MFWKSRLARIIGKWIYDNQAGAQWVPDYNTISYGEVWITKDKRTVRVRYDIYTKALVVYDATSRPSAVIKLKELDSALHDWLDVVSPAVKYYGAGL